MRARLAGVGRIEPLSGPELAFKTSLKPPSLIGIVLYLASCIALLSRTVY